MTDSARAHTARRTLASITAPALLTLFFIAAGAPTPLTAVYEGARGYAPWVLTIAFGAYSVALLATLLFVGGVSDYIGRRPILLCAVALEIVSMAVFLAGTSVITFFVARALQGVATALASSSFSAATIELLPDRRKKLGSLLTSLVPTIGLGLGALFGGLAWAWSANAITIAWATLLLAFGAGLVLTAFTPETVTRRSGALRSMIPRLSLPSSVRRLFRVSVPTIIGAMMTIALYLALIPIILQAVFRVGNPLLTGLVALAAFAAASIASGATAWVSPRALRHAGATLQIVAALGLVWSVAGGVFLLIWAVAILQGVALGLSFSGVTRGLVPEVELHQRAKLFTAIWLVVYSTLAISAILAGVSSVVFGPVATAVGFGTVQAIASAIGLTLSLSALRSRRVRERHDLRPEPDAS